RRCTSARSRAASGSAGSLRRYVPMLSFYPCRCLWRGLLLQMTMVRPCRLMTRQRSHMGLTDGRTFMTPGCSLSKRRARTTASRRGSSWYQDPGARSEDPRALRGDRHGVLEVGRQRAVLGRDRPLVVVDVDLGLADRDHRLDCDRHALLQLRPTVGRD